MEWLNYHHLLYFWVVAREGSIAKACQELRLAQPTISGQLKSLEESFGEPLFDRVGRGLVLTETGQLVFRYAEQIFALGKELTNAVKGNAAGRSLVVGIVDALPKLVSHHLLQPARTLPEPVKLVCREGRPEELYALLALHELDLVISDAPMGAHVRVKAFSHPLGESGISFFAAPSVASRLEYEFPRSLDGVPMLLPTSDSALRSLLERWFVEINIRPTIIGEFADSALMTIFGDAGDGVFPAPTVVTDALLKSGLQCVGTTDDVTEQFYLISTERKVKHPAVTAILANAKKTLLSM